MADPKQDQREKWTPGPWRWHGYYLMQDCVCPNNNAPDHGESCGICENGRVTNPYGTPAGRPIADDGSAGGEYNETIDPNGPDAHLIAQAPRLYEALQLAYRYLFTGEGPDEIDAAELATEIEAVLAAARGEQG